MGFLYRLFDVLHLGRTAFFKELTEKVHPAFNITMFVLYVDALKVPSGLLSVGNGGSYGKAAADGAGSSTTRAGGSKSSSSSSAGTRKIGSGVVGGGGGAAGGVGAGGDDGDDEDDPKKAPLNFT